MNDSNLLTYRIATANDCHSLSVLVNNSYRSELACQGWTHANEIMYGLRTNSEILYNTINESDSVILAFFDKSKQILVGCIHLKHKSEMKMAYFEMLAVRPNLQARGYGKFIISVAEKYLRTEWNVEYIQLSVVFQRPELVDYYRRRGFIDTGHRQPLYSSTLCPLKRDDLELCIMRKYLKMEEEKISS